MAYVVLSRTRERTTTTGTGDITVSGVISGNTKPFSANMAIGDTSTVCILSGNSIDWEECVITYSAANTLQRGAVRANSAGDSSHIDLTGDSRVFGIIDPALLIPASFASLTDASVASLANNDFAQYQSADSKWHNRTPAQATASLIAMVGDTGSGGTKGLVPAPAAGDAAAGKLLGANGNFIIPYIVGWHYPATMATTAALPANTYSNGTAGVGATLTGNSNGALPAQDGVTPVVGYRLLVKNEAATANNGIYVVTQVGTGGTPYILTRATDFDSPNNINQGDVVVVGPNASANSNATAFFQVTASASPIVVGTTGLTWQSLTPIFVGDSGSGGVKGFVPAPAAGDAAAGKVLGAGGGWVVPSASGSFGSATTVSANNTSGTVQLTGIPAFDRLQIIVEGLKPATAGATFLLQFGSGATPTWQTGSNYSWVAQFVDGSSFSTITTAEGTTSIGLETGGAAADRDGWSAELILIRKGTAYFLTGTIVGWENTGTRHLVNVRQAGFFNNSVTLTAMRIVASAGFIVDGAVSIYPISR